MVGPGSWGPVPQGYGPHQGYGPPPQGQGYPAGYRAPQGHGPPPGRGMPQGYGPPPGQGGPYPPHGPPQGPPRPPYGAGYGYVPPQRRRGGGGVRAVGVLGLLAVVGIGVSLVSRLADRPAYTPVRPPITLPGRGSAGGAGGEGGTADAATSRLYQIGRLPSTGCRGRTIVQGDPRSFRLFLDSTSDCLDRAWQQGFARAGMRFTAPNRVFWTTPGAGPCGNYPSPGVAAFYCPANASMYIGVTDAQKAAGGLPVRYNVAYTREIAHEYGHAVQDLSGILRYQQDARSAAGSPLERNAVTKRTELQAQCLSGVFMGSVQSTFPITSEQWGVALRDSYARGDDGRPLGSRDHGTNAHYRGWVQVGFARGGTAACNTWTAPAQNVS